MGDDEKRASHRADTDIFVFVQRGMRRSLCQAVDVSLAGARLLPIDPPLLLGQMVTLEFEPPNHEAFSVVGEVVRVLDDASTGLRFRGLSERLKNAIRDTIYDDRRASPRTEVEIEVLFTRDERRHAARAIDLSCGGMRVQSMASLGYNPLDIVVFDLSLEVDGQTHSMSLVSKALREHDDGSMSFTFLAVSEDDAELLDAYIASRGWIIF